MSNHKTCNADGCPRPVPDSKRFDAVYCSLKCKKREALRRYRATHPALAEAK